MESQQEAERVYLRDSSFVISCAARTGSTFLVHLLRSNPQVLCHGEVINTKGLGPMTGTYERNRHAIDGYDDLLSEEFRSNPARFVFNNLLDSQGRRAVGFKYKTDEAFLPDYLRYTDIIASDESIKVIRLRRRNLLDQYISHQVVLKQTGVTLLREGEEAPPIERFTCDTAHALSYFANVVSREEQAAATYARHRSFSIDYEQLVANETAPMVAMQEFLGVDPIDLSSPTKKIIGNNQDLLGNLDETRSVLVSAGFESRLA